MVCHGPVVWHDAHLHVEWNHSYHSKIFRSNQNRSPICLRVKASSFKTGTSSLKWKIPTVNKQYLTEQSEVVMKFPPHQVQSLAYLPVIISPRILTVSLLWKWAVVYQEPWRNLPSDIPFRDGHWLATVTVPEHETNITRSRGERKQWRLWKQWWGTKASTTWQ